MDRMTNTFGRTVARTRLHATTMEPTDVLDSEAVPDRAGHETLDVRELPPPKPLQETLEAVVDLGDVVLIQINDRRPQHLFPKLEERGLEYESTGEDPVYTAIWKP
ncbi:SirA-like two-layered alpha/beta sandwich domain [Halapricum desulfuricans]|uniref:SirA-like two-layered alpha/beta sandwich domain n=2 Tax=Halapricum desulfuricans TaxID=2841257 RepID=A0A897MV97_9EURY|nr:SirA-like two-layered alpha/beta sandwich domain [Halapricum desulfuricans]